MTVKAVAQRFCDERTLVYLSIPSVQLTFQTLILKVSDDEMILKNTIPLDQVAMATEADEIFLQLGMNKLEAKRLGSNGVNIVFPYQTMTKIVETRVAERFSFSKEENVVCRLLNPIDEQTWIERPLVDMSDSGLSIACTRSSPLFSSGRAFDRIEILLDGDPYTKTSGKVVYTRPVVDLNGQLFVQVGFATQ